MKVIGYARASTQGQKITIGKQERMIREYCGDNGYELVQVFSEQVSGRTDLMGMYGVEGDTFPFLKLQRRPQLGAAFDRADSGDIDRVIVVNSSRLARKIHYQGILEEAYEMVGAPVEYVEPASSWLEHRIKGIMEEWEVRQSTKRTTEALEEKQHNNEWLGKPPYGFYPEEDAEGEPTGKLCKDPDEWDTLQRVRSLLENGVSMAEIARETGLKYSQVRAIKENREENKYRDEYKKYLIQGE